MKKLIGSFLLGSAVCYGGLAVADSPVTVSFTNNTLTNKGFISVTSTENSRREITVYISQLALGATQSAQIGDTINDNFPILVGQKDVGPSYPCILSRSDLTPNAHYVVTGDDQGHGMKCTKQ